MRYINLLLLFFINFFRPITSEDCNFKLSSTSGIIEFSPSTSTADFCRWTLDPPPKSQYMLQVLKAKLPPNFELVVYANNDEFKVPKNCDHCVKDLVSPAINILLQKLPSKVEKNSNISSVFRILFKSFVPGYCSPPEEVKNGVLIGDSYKTGKSVMYVCPPPYHIVGEAIIHCEASNESVIPHWNTAPPSCSIPSCSGAPVKLIADTRGKAVVNPGYETGRIKPSQMCWWDIETASNNQQVKINFEYLDVFGNDGKTDTTIEFYDGSLDKPILNISSASKNVSEIISETNRLVIIYRTGIKVPVNATGFLMNYSSVSINCPMLEHPSNGFITPRKKSYGLGDTIRLGCDSGYKVDPAKTILTCLITDSWSGSFGDCEPSLEVVNVTEQNFKTEIKTSIVDYDPFSVISSTELPKVKPTKVTKKKYKPIKTTKKVKKYQKNFTIHASIPSLNISVPIKNHNKTFKDHKMPGAQNMNKIKNKVSRKSGPTRSYRPQSTKLPISVTQPVETVDIRSGFSGIIKIEILFIVLGTTVPILLIIISIAIFVVYRRRYPARMVIGRKFSTFENPVYERRGPRIELLPDSEPAEVQN